MKIIHIADLHLGQIIYQCYDRVDEHAHFFNQLEKCCSKEKPDALVVSGDIFDIQQPSAATRKAFNQYFADLHTKFPEMGIVITAGNHDSASRIEADSSVWNLVNVHLVGMSPSIDLLNKEEGWQDRYIIEIPSGYIIALPFMMGNRKELVQSILDRVSNQNKEEKPVVLMGHLAVTGMDCTGHGFEIGQIQTQDVSSLGNGYDYMALGHIHMPQTIGHPEDRWTMDKITYPSGVIRYSGSALHVSCDEQYPHTISIVEMDHHNGNVSIRQERIDELRHFYILPEQDMNNNPDETLSFHDEKKILDAVKQFADKKGRGYFRLRIDYKTPLSSNFNQMIYDLIDQYGEEIRYNPKIIWTGNDELEKKNEEKPKFEIEDFQEMKNPLVFVEKTIDQYPDLDLDDVREAFDEVFKEINKKSEK